MHFEPKQNAEKFYQVCNLFVTLFLMVYILLRVKLTQKFECNNNNNNNNNNNLLTYNAPVTWKDAHRRITKENQSHGLHFKIMRIFTSIWKH
jgi:hypothetical protein